MATIVKQAFDEQIELFAAEGLVELERLLRQPSVSAQNVGMRECAELIAQALRGHGARACIMETGGYPVDYGEIGAGERALQLYNHYDVQPPEPLELWDTPPFEPTWRDDKLFARGAAADKGHFISRLAELDAWRAARGGELPYTIKFLVEGEEEIGSPHLVEFIRDHAELLAAEACVWEAGGVDEAGRPDNCIGLRGILCVELRVRTALHDAHSGEQSYLPNAAWRLVWALGTLNDHAERVLIPGFYDAVHPPTARQLELLAAAPSLEQQERRF